MEYVIVSACLLGVACRYDGVSKPCKAVLDLIEREGTKENPDIILIPVCPEQLGGLATPRVPSERCHGPIETAVGACFVKNDDYLDECSSQKWDNIKVINQAGVDVSAQYKKGAEESLKIARLYSCKKAILKEKSPSCGCGQIYDGTFTRTLTKGNGVTADLFLNNGIEVVGEKQLSRASLS